jgi:hypothetical protein
MKFLQSAVLLFSALLLAVAFSPRAQADEWNKLTYFTFSAPFEVPGYHRPMVLPAGRYEFKLLDSESNRDIVQIFNKNGTHLYDTVLAIPDYRMTPTSKSVIQFRERATGSPEAIKAWFYPGDNFGQEFVYPKSRAMELAKANNEPVLSMPDETAANMTKPVTSAKDSSVTAMKNTPVKAEEPNGNEVEASQVVTSEPSNANASNTSNENNKLVAQNNQNNSKTLPKTASEMPLAVLSGMFLLGFGVGLRLATRAPSKG